MTLAKVSFPLFLSILNIDAESNFRNVAASFKGLHQSRRFLTNDMIAVMSDSGLLPSAAWGRLHAKGAGGPQDDCACGWAGSRLGRGLEGAPWGLSITLQPTVSFLTL